MRVVLWILVVGNKQHIGVFSTMMQGNVSSRVILQVCEWGSLPCPLLQTFDSLTLPLTLTATNCSAGEYVLLVYKRSPGGAESPSPGPDDGLGGHPSAGRRGGLSDTQLWSLVGGSAGACLLLITAAVLLRRGYLASVKKERANREWGST